MMITTRKEEYFDASDHRESHGSPSTVPEKALFIQLIDALSRSCIASTQAPGTIQQQQPKYITEFGFLNKALLCPEVYSGSVSTLLLLLSASFLLPLCLEHEQLIHLLVPSGSFYALPLVEFPLRTFYAQAYGHLQHRLHDRTCAVVDPCSRSLAMAST